MTPEELRRFLEKQDGELKALVTKGDHELQVHSARLLALEQHATRGVGGGSMSMGGDESIGEAIVRSEGFAALVKGARSSGRMPFKSLSPRELKIVSGTWSAAPDYRPVVAFPPQPALPVRALMPNIPTTSNLVEFPLETAFTNAANYQLTEGTDKPQSDATYSLTQQPICTIAHWLAASRQLLDDSTAFAAYVNARMVFKLEQVPWLKRRKIAQERLTSVIACLRQSARACPDAAPPAYRPPDDQKRDNEW